METKIPVTVKRNDKSLFKDRKLKTQREVIWSVFTVFLATYTFTSRTILFFIHSLQWLKHGLTRISLPRQVLKQWDHSSCCRYLLKIVFLFGRFLIKLIILFLDFFWKSYIKTAHKFSTVWHYMPINSMRNASIICDSFANFTIKATTFYCTRSSKIP